MPDASAFRPPLGPAAYAELKRRREQARNAEAKDLVPAEGGEPILAGDGSPEQPDDDKTF